MKTKLYSNLNIDALDLLVEYNFCLFDSVLLCLSATIFTYGFTLNSCVNVSFGTCAVPETNFVVILRHAQGGFKAKA
jgi:hypothetical protein